MAIWAVIWDEEGDPNGNVEHVAQHDLTMDDVECALANPLSHGISQSSGLPVLWGYALDGRHIIVVYEEVEAGVVRVITAYEVPEREE